MEKGEAQAEDEDDAPPRPTSAELSEGIARLLDDVYEALATDR